MADRNGYIGRAPGDSSVHISRRTFTPTTATTDFTFTPGYVPGYIDVFLNGVKLVQSDDYVATNGSVVSLTVAAQNGDAVELVAYKAFNIAYVDEATGNFNVGTDLTVGGKLGVGSDANISGIITAGNGIDAFDVLRNGSTVASGIITAIDFVGNVVQYDSTAGIVTVRAGAGGTWVGDTPTGISTTKSIGVNTSSVADTDLVGVGNSFNGVYISNGMLIVDKELNGDHYIGTNFNGLMVGPVTVNGTLSIDGDYVVV
jgi:hypothetical protein